MALCVHELHHLGAQVRDGICVNHSSIQFDDRPAFPRSASENSQRVFRDSLNAYRILHSTTVDFFIDKATNDIGMVLPSMISSRYRLVTGTSAVGMRKNSSDRVA